MATPFLKGRARISTGDKTPKHNQTESAHRAEAPMNGESKQSARQQPRQDYATMRRSFKLWFMILSNIRRPSLNALSLLCVACESLDGRRRESQPPLSFLATASLANSVSIS